MPGMNSGLNPADPTLVAAFRSALFHQGAIALIAIVFLWLIWATARTWRVAPPAGKGKAASAAGQTAEARGRRLLRIGFGLLWIFDGILQAQPKMAGGLASQVIEPTATASPEWVQHLVNWGGTAWSYHPIQAGAASVWIQIGIGAWLIVAPRGLWSRLAGVRGWSVYWRTFRRALMASQVSMCLVLPDVPGATRRDCSCTPCPRAGHAPRSATTTARPANGGAGHGPLS